MKPIFICLVAWENGRERSYPSHGPSQSDFARAQQRTQQMIAAQGSLLESLSSALMAIVTRLTFGPSRKR
jgi:hypothetical protein